ncbi:GGDEF domain-containing protein [Streptomyces omiyaensis]|uniref:GGDEF domain-containing protein n=1 Tax=Streptomyces omiyaensis TaxID=68247 RepID=UPI0037009136
MPSGIETGALLDRARTDLARPDASPVDLRRHLTRVVPAVEELLAENAALHGQLARARTCPVTHLPTRAAWTERAGQVLAQGPTVVLLVDLDGFKPVNDRFGHAAGDDVLAAVGARLAAWSAAAGGTAGRLGGDEFSVAVPDTPGLDLDALRALLTRPVRHQDLTLTVGASIGSAHGPAAADLSALLKTADAAMYQAKGRGRRGRRLAPLARLARVLPFRKAA